MNFLERKKYEKFAFIKNIKESQKEEEKHLEERVQVRHHNGIQSADFDKVIIHLPFLFSFFLFMFYFAMLRASLQTLLCCIFCFKSNFCMHIRLLFSKRYFLACVNYVCVAIPFICFLVNDEKLVGIHLSCPSSILLSQLII